MANGEQVIAIPINVWLSNNYNSKFDDDFVLRLCNGDFRLNVSEYYSGECC
jgi:hypothetical protein